MITALSATETIFFSDLSTSRIESPSAFRARTLAHISWRTAGARPAYSDRGYIGVEMKATVPFKFPTRKDRRPSQSERS